ncbi:hypothetical protein [Halorussus aquaticus]|uniref:Yip1 domain-containing protein n=1 Tax=Halorussus aquaticus TaxID=2953748 RepID=A0ABD5Q3N5_9EURY|nr:hypothetical protein [Halorussus aquaticus]
MNWYAALRPRRSLVLPLLAVAVPALYFVYRDAAMGCPSARPCLGAAHAGYALVGLAGAYLAAVVVLAFADASALASHHPYARLAFRPTDRTLAVLGVFGAATATYLLATLVATVPGWLDLVLAPFGLVLALPFAVSYAGMVVVTDALLSEPPTRVQTVVVAVSLALTAVWVFALATGTAGLLGSWLPASAESR